MRGPGEVEAGAAAGAAVVSGLSTPRAWSGELPNAVLGFSAQLHFGRGGRAAARGCARMAGGVSMLLRNNFEGIIYGHALGRPAAAQ